MFDLTRLLFWLVSAGVLSSAVLVVSTKKPVVGILALIACFVQAAVLWLLPGAEFLSMGLIFVYVGAVMTLFLFVVMMLNQDQVAAYKHGIKLLGFMVFVFLSYAIFKAILPKQVTVVTSLNNTVPNVNQIGNVLYTKYMLSFEITAMILLVAMLAAITLVFRGRKNNQISVAKQVQVKAKDRVKLTDLKG